MRVKSRPSSVNLRPAHRRAVLPPAGAPPRDRWSDGPGVASLPSGPSAMARSGRREHRGRRRGVHVHRGRREPAPGSALRRGGLAPCARAPRRHDRNVRTERVSSTLSRGRAHGPRRAGSVDAQEPPPRHRGGPRAVRRGGDAEPAVHRRQHRLGLAVPDRPGTARRTSLPPAQRERLDDERSVRYFERLYHGDEPFEAVHDALYDDRLFPAVDVHGTTTRWVYVFERKRR